MDIGVWVSLFAYFALMIAIGLYARVILPDLGAGLTGSALDTATEKALPMLATHMLPEVLVGVILAGLFAATMSTADSQVLSCSAAVTQDVFPRFSKSARASKVATLSVAILALIIALVADAGVFSIVLMAWSILGAAFGPILIVRLAGWRLPAGLALVMMAVGVGTVVLWGASPWAGDVFKALPGLLAPMVVYGACAPFLRRPSVSPPPAP
mgnify:CR=1 FL=1